MKIGITADVHLKKNKKESPERYKALGSILNTLKEKDISTLIVAGDLFNKECNNYSQFNKLCQQNDNIDFLVIPGNHDPGISSTHFTADNLEVIESPKIKEIGGISFFFVPYNEKKAMGEILAEYEQELPDKWILISHGDYLSGRVPENPYEVGTYMPINRSDLQRFKPKLAVLGHIHKRSEYENLRYTGSPFPLHINETGPRYFSLMDLDSLSYKKEKIDSNKIYFNETLLMLPLEAEKEYAEKQIKEMISNWNISEEELKKVVLRLEVRGYVKNLKVIKKTIEKNLEEINFYEDSPDFSKIAILKTGEKLEIVQKIKDAIEEKKDLIKEKGLSKKQVLEKAFKKVLN
ncbi:MAG: metallophosphoesterase [Minisyncoccales bacterium]